MLVDPTYLPLVKDTLQAKRRQRGPRVERKSDPEGSFEKEQEDRVYGRVGAQPPKDEGSEVDRYL
ncbi:MAG: hypothetical protein JRJ59_10745 [Deltaproteobacteria bacterium]|nr:hypothetical protein [Deltaproteobacteria bacterium]